MVWLNEPPRWDRQAGEVSVVAAAGTDFWRITHDGGVRDNGHFLFQTAADDFDLQVRVAGNYRDQYDQAGLMIRAGAQDWIKCGVEFKDGGQFASVVVTRDSSDWSVVRLADPPSVWFKLCRRGPDVEAFFSLDGEQFEMMRQTRFPAAGDLQAGIMIAAPTGAGFAATFYDPRVIGR